MYEHNGNIRYYLDKLIQDLEESSENYSYKRVGVVEELQASVKYGNILIEFISGAE